MMFFEPAQIPDVFFPAGFTELPGGANQSSLHVMNDHSYGPCALGEVSSDIFPLCKEYHEVKLSQRDSDAKKFNVPLIISEFGACPESDSCVAEVQSLVEVCDEHLSSWAYWQFKKYGDLTTTAMDTSEGFYTSEGFLQARKIKALTRTYFKAT